MLRAKPAVAMVIAEVASEVTLDCGGGPTTVKPPPFRETGTGWFIDSCGWLVTNGHVVQPAYEKTPRWLVNQHANRAVSMACLPKALEKAGINPGEHPTRGRDQEEAAGQRAPNGQGEVQAQVLVLVPNGTSLKAQVVKYSPPVAGDPSGMSGRDLALLKVPGENFPVLRLADTKVDPDRRPHSHHRIPRRGRLARAPEQVGVGRGVGDQRRRLRLQGGRRATTR